MKIPSKAKMLEDLYESELKYWLKIAKHNPKAAATKIALIVLDDYLRDGSDKILEDKWRKMKNGDE